VNPDTGESNVTESQIEAHDTEREKLVPVTESIRYRKRAQSAEEQAEALSRELAETKAGASEMAEKLQSIQFEQRLMRKLSASGAVDLETAVLLAKARIKDDEGTEIDDVIEQLKKEKHYLFGGQQNLPGSGRKSAGVKDKVSNRQARLAGAAKKAATSGNRVDLQEYLKLRRNFV